MESAMRRSGVSAAAGVILAACIAALGAVDFESYAADKPLAGQDGWSVSAPEGIMAAKPAVPNGSNVAGAIRAGSGPAAVVVAEKGDAAVAGAIAYGAWICPQEQAGSLYVGVRVARKPDQPMTAGEDAGTTGLGPRFGLAMQGKLRFVIVPAGQPASQAFWSKREAAPGKWYELVLLLKPAPDPRRSTGSLFFREAAGPAEKLQAVEDLQDVPLNLSADARPETFNTWVVVANGGLVDNLVADKASARLAAMLPSGQADARLVQLQQEAAAMTERLKAAQVAGVAAMKQVADLEAKIKALEGKLKQSEADVAKWKESADKSSQDKAEQQKQATLLAKQLGEAKAEAQKLTAEREKRSKELAAWQERAGKAEKRLAEIDAAKKKIPPWRNKDNWRKIEAGQTPEQVKAVLGEPGKVFSGMVGGKPRLIWYYPSIFGGNVEFEEGKVKAWREP